MKERSRGVKREEERLRSTALLDSVVSTTRTCHTFITMIHIEEFPGRAMKKSGDNES